jgi:hypothetical protein
MNRVAILFAFLAFSASRDTVADEVISRSGDVSGKSIFFLPGKPSESETLMDSIYDGSKELLAGNIEILRSHAIVKVELVGTADSLECSGKACSVLAERRVRLIHNWLVSNGIPESSIVKSVARGLDLPLTDSLDPEERLVNRRVEFNLTL